MNTSASRRSPWLWEELEPGLSFEPQNVTVAQEDLARWNGMHGAAGTGGQTGLALFVPLMMRAFIAASAPRVPGNIHVSQDMRFCGRPPRLGEELRFLFTVGDRIEKKGRGWVDILVTCRSAANDEMLMDGKLVLIWAGRMAGGAVSHG